MMLNNEQKSALINLSFEAEEENYNQYWLTGFVQFLNLFDDRNKAQREKIFKFLTEASPVTQRLFLELMLMVS